MSDSVLPGAKHITETIRNNMESLANVSELLNKLHSKKAKCAEEINNIQLQISKMYADLIYNYHVASSHIGKQATGKDPTFPTYSSKDWERWAVECKKLNNQILELTNQYFEFSKEMKLIDFEYDTIIRILWEEPKEL